MLDIPCACMLYRFTCIENERLSLLPPASVDVQASKWNQGVKKQEAISWTKFSPWRHLNKCIKKSMDRYNEVKMIFSCRR